METLRQQIGQMFLIGCQGATLSRAEQLICSEYQFGGMVLFQRNCLEPGQLAQLCRGFWDLATNAPPFIAIDHEGGRVHRLPAPFSHFPAAARLSDHCDTILARRFGRAVAEELKLVGINLNFAPVLDVDSNPASPVIGERAFACDPTTVIEIGAAWAQGLRDGGVIPCGKHFPGHGGTDEDSHFDLPIVKKTLAELETVELAPFAHACRAGIESLMTAHVLYPALDGSFPATLSECIITGLLRHQFGYDGVVFSDDMAMQALTTRYSVEETTLQAVRAGVDVMLYCHEVDKALQAFEFLCQAAERDAAVRALVQASHRRISALKGRYLKNFTGVPEAAIIGRLEAMRHRRLIEQT